MRIAVNSAEEQCCWNHFENDYSFSWTIKTLTANQNPLMLSGARAFKVPVKSKWTILIFFMGYCSIYCEWFIQGFFFSPPLAHPTCIIYHFTF